MIVVSETERYMRTDGEELHGMSANPDCIEMWRVVYVDVGAGSESAPLYWPRDLPFLEPT